MLSGPLSAVALFSFSCDLRVSYALTTAESAFGAAGRAMITEDMLSRDCNERPFSINKELSASGFVGLFAAPSDTH